MIKSKVAQQRAENLIVQYVDGCNCKTADDIANVLEALISKSARAIEKYAGNEKAIDVCRATKVNLQLRPASYKK